MMKGLREIEGLDIPEDVASPECNAYLKAACEKFELHCSPPQTTARLLDKVLYCTVLYAPSAPFWSRDTELTGL